MWLCACACVPCVRVCESVCGCLCVCVSECVNMWVDVCVNACVCVWICEYVSMCGCEYVCVFPCVCVWVYLWVAVCMYERAKEIVYPILNRQHGPALPPSAVMDKSGQIRWSLFICWFFFICFLTGTVSALNLQEGFLRCDGDSSCALGAGSQLLVKASAQRRKLQPDYGVGSQLHHVSTIWKVLAYSHLPIHLTLPNNWTLTCPSCQIPFLPSLMIALF